MFTRTLSILTIALAAAMPAPAQQVEPESRQQLQERLRLLQQEMRELQRRLGEDTRRDARAYAVTPRAGSLIRMSMNRARLGVTIRTDRSSPLDSIGAELTAVTPGGPADEAGLRSGDILTTFNGERLGGRYDPDRYGAPPEAAERLLDLVRELEPGDTIEVDYRRGRETRKATVVAQAAVVVDRLEPNEWFGFSVEPPDVRIKADRIRDMARGMSGNFSFSFSDPWLDMELVSLNPDLGEYFGTTEGLLVVRAPDEASLTLKAGDVILKIGGRTPTSQASAARILRSYDDGESVEFEIMRQKRKMTVTGTMPERDREHDHDELQRRF